MKHSNTKNVSFIAAIVEEVTTQFQSLVLINSEMTIAFPDKADAITRTWKANLLLKRQFKNKKQMKVVCYNITPVLGSSAGYR